MTYEEFVRALKDATFAPNIVRGTDQDDLKIINNEDGFGIFIGYTEQQEETRTDAQNITLITGYCIQLNADNLLHYGVALLCKNREYLNIFALICWGFATEFNRQEILTNPYEQFDKLLELTGNHQVNREPRSIFAEFVTYLYLFKKYSEINKKVSWVSGTANHDIQGEDGAQFEVKETKNQDYIIHISSKLQTIAAPNQKFELYFCKLVDETDGKSLNDLIEIAQGLGCDMDAIEQCLSRAGFPKTSRKRKSRFMLQEVAAYDMTAPEFPKITPDSFGEGVNLAAVPKFSYDIDLNVLDAIKQSKTDEFRELLS